MSRRRIGVNLRNKDELIEVQAYAVATSADGERPIMLFRKVQGDTILPVYLSPIDAGIAISQNQVAQVPVSPHTLSLKVLEQLGIKLEWCVFTEVRGHHQFVQLWFSGNRKLKPMVVRADQAISFSLQAKAKFYCTMKYIEESKVIRADMAGALRDLKKYPEVGKNRHPYLN